jgi:hypothetical protein
MRKFIKDARQNKRIAKQMLYFGTDDILFTIFFVYLAQ